MNSGLGSTIFTLFLPQQPPWHRSGPILNDGMHQRPLSMGSLDDITSKVVSTDLQGLCTMKNLKTSPHNPKSYRHRVQSQVNKSPGPVRHSADGFNDSPFSQHSNTSPQPCLFFFFKHYTDIINAFFLKGTRSKS